MRSTSARDAAVGPATIGDFRVHPAYRRRAGTRRAMGAALMATVTLASAVFAQSNIDPSNKHAWGENIGWTNWRDAGGGADGVVVGVDALSGFLWAENVGYIHVGDGGGPYGNTNGTDYGVNILPNGDLAGYGWGENIGWVNFGTPSATPDQARFDAAEGRFKGYAWGENVGWINLNDTEPGKFVAVGAGPPTGVPVLSEWGMLDLMVLLVIAAVERTGHARDVSRGLEG